MPFDDEMFSSGRPEEDEDNIFGVADNKAIGQVIEDFV
jgi:hypothetical protein